MADRQRCWECIRRRLVCDNGRPRCNRCKTSGIDCTGYGAKKPVQFLEPGVVLSRPRKNKPGANQIGRLIGHAETKTDRTKCPKKEVDLCLVVGPKVDPQLQIGREALSTGLDRQVHGVVRQQFRTEVDDIIEAISYWDDATQSWFAGSEFKGNPFSATMQGRADLIPAPSRHIMTVLALSHRIHKFSIDCKSRGTDHLRLRRHEHMDRALHLLRERIATGLSAESYGTITSVILFNKLELMYSDVVDWRGHISAFMSLMQMAGGLQKLYKEDARFRLHVLTIMITNVVANTTSPAKDQYMTEYYFKHLSWVSEVYGICDYPPFPCPKQLFLHIVRINHLRSNPRGLKTSEMIIVLNETTNFSPEQWASSKPSEHYHFWLALARIYQSAVMLYATGVVTFSSATLQSKISYHLGRLLQLLDLASESCFTIYSIIWPAMVAGARLYDKPEAERRIVRECLGRLANEGNYSLPHRALDVLEKSWASGVTEWDDVFSTPYMFVV